MKKVIVELVYFYVVTVTVMLRNNHRQDMDIVVTGGCICLLIKHFSALEIQYRVSCVLYEHHFLILCLDLKVRSYLLSI